MRRLLVLVTVVATFVGLLTYVERTPASEPSQAADTFDSNRAWEHLRQLVAIGPRPAGSAGIRPRRTASYFGSSTTTCVRAPR